MTAQTIQLAIIKDAHGTTHTITAHKANSYPATTGIQILRTFTVEDTTHTIRLEPGTHDTAIYATLIHNIILIALWKYRRIRIDFTAAEVTRTWLREAIARLPKYTLTRILTYGASPRTRRHLRQEIDRIHNSQDTQA
jgi:hypothetical protein